MVKAVFHLSLRATPEFLESVVRLMGVELPVPDYTTVSRRQGGLELKLGPAPACELRHVVIDATGLKNFGAGEWCVGKHGMGTAPNLAETASRRGREDERYRGGRSDNERGPRQLSPAGVARPGGGSDQPSLRGPSLRQRCVLRSDPR